MLPEPLKVPYAREGARIYDGHQPGQVLTTLKRAKIRGVESYSMICSEKELGISDEHEGVIILDGDAPVGVPLVDYMGDAVLEIAITPNIAREPDPGRGARPPPSWRRCASPNQIQRAVDQGPGLARDHRAGAQPALRARPDRGHPDQAQPVLGAAPAAHLGHAPDQQHRRRHQLRHAGGRRAAARLRLRRAGAAPVVNHPPS
jgi:hypothetical protein